MRHGSGIARRDRELARQILMAHRRLIEPGTPSRAARRWPIASTSTTRSCSSACRSRPSATTAASSATVAQARDARAKRPIRRPRASGKRERRPQAVVAAVAARSGPRRRKRVWRPLVRARRETARRRGPPDARTICSRRHARPLRRRRAVRLRVPRPRRGHPPVSRARPRARRRSRHPRARRRHRTHLRARSPRDGHRVIALDSMPTMLDRLGERAPTRARSARVHRAAARRHARAADGRRSVDLVIAPFNALMHLYDVAGLARAAFARWRACSCPAARSRSTCRSPTSSGCAGIPRRATRSRGSCTRGPARSWSTRPNHPYDPETQICHIRIYYDDAPPSGRQVRGARGRSGSSTSRTARSSPRRCAMLVAHRGADLARAHCRLPRPPLEDAKDIAGRRLRQTARAAYSGS